MACNKIPRSSLNDVSIVLHELEDDEDGCGHFKMICKNHGEGNVRLWRGDLLSPYDSVRLISVDTNRDVAKLPPPFPADVTCEDIITLTPSEEYSTRFYISDIVSTTELEQVGNVSVRWEAGGYQEQFREEYSLSAGKVNSQDLIWISGIR